MPYFQKFTQEDSCSTVAAGKQSQSRGIRASVLQAYPSLEPVIEDLIPKKEQLVVAKCQDHIQIALRGGKEPILKLWGKFPRPRR